MSVIQYPEGMKASDLQIWNNVAFDDGDMDESAAIKASSWCPLEPILVNQTKTHDLDSWKENKSPVPLNSPVPIKQANSKGKPLKLLFKQGLLSPPLTNSKNVNEANRDDSKIDTEIEEIETEINRLASKLEALRLEKAEQNLKTTEKVEKIQKKIGGNLAANPNSKIQRKGVSLGPMEIFASVRSRPTMKPEVTLIKSTQSRRKSCFYKLEEINEEKATKERGGRSLSLSPTSRRSVSKTQSSRQGFTTVGSKKSVKKDEGLLSGIQPKKLFKEGEKYVGAKKPIKSGRAVPSRYNQNSSQSTGIQKQTDQRKNSFENGKKKQVPFVGQSPGFPLETSRSNVTELRVKKRWEIPSNVLVDSPKTSLLKMADLLPKIKTIRCVEECSPRDSGPAKRAAELIARKSYFGAESIELEKMADLSCFGLRRRID